MQTYLPSLLLILSCASISVNAGFWSFGDSLEDLWKPIDATDDKSISTSDDSKALPTGAVANIRKMIQDELTKGQSSKTAVTNSATTAANEPTTESPEDMIRRVIAEELAKMVPATTTSAPTSAPFPVEPIWMSWANAKNWAKQPGPNGEAPAGFINSLQYRFGQGEGGPSAAGSPGWVWSQISSKWADKDEDKETAEIPPSRIIKSGNWKTVLPP